MSRESFRGFGFVLTSLRLGFAHPVIAARVGTDPSSSCLAPGVARGGAFRAALYPSSGHETLD